MAMPKTFTVLRRSAFGAGSAYRCVDSPDIRWGIASLETLHDYAMGHGNTWVSRVFLLRERTTSRTSSVSLCAGQVFAAGLAARAS
jgi:hypothetical protein